MSSIQSSQSVSSKNGYVLSLRIARAHSRSVHVIKAVDRSRKHTTWVFTLCGQAYTVFEMFDTIEDVPPKWKDGAELHMCPICKRLDK